MDTIGDIFNTKATGWMEYDDLQKYRRDKKKGKISQ